MSPADDKILAGVLRRLLTWEPKPDDNGVQFRWGGFGGTADTGYTISIDASLTLTAEEGAALERLITSDSTSG